MAEPGERLWTVEAFFAWQERQSERYELVGGFPLRMMAGARNRHDDIVVNLVSALRVRLRGSACRPFTGDGSVQTHPGEFRRPYAGVDCGQRGPDAYKAADPRLVAEVLSPSPRALHKVRRADPSPQGRASRHQPTGVGRRRGRVFPTPARSFASTRPSPLGRDQSVEFLCKAHSTRDVDTIENLAEYAPQVVIWIRDTDRSWSRSLAEGLEAEIALHTLGITPPLADLFEGVAFPPAPRLGLA